MLKDDGAADGEAEAAAALLTGIGGVHLLEAAKDGLQLIGGNTAALVDDGDGDAGGAGANHDGNGGVGRGELDGVGEEVSKDLEQAVGVAGDFGLGGVVQKLDAGGVGHGLHPVDGLADDLRELQGAEGDGFLAALDALEIEDVVDEADQAVRVGDGDAEEVGGLVINVAEDAGGEQAERAADGGERGAELVADGGDELVLEAVEGVALADVAEAEHGTGKAALVEDGGEDVFGGQGAPSARIEGVLAGAWLSGGRWRGGGCTPAALAAGGSRAVEDVMDGLAGEARRGGAEQARGRWIGEADHAAAVHAADAVGDGVEQDLLLAIEFLGAAAFLGAGQHLAERSGHSLHGGEGLGVLAQTLAGVKLEYGQALVADANRDRPAGGHAVAQAPTQYADSAARGKIDDPVRCGLPARRGRAGPLREPTSGRCSPGRGRRRQDRESSTRWRIPAGSRLALTSHLMPASHPWETHTASTMRMAASSGELLSPTIWLTTNCNARRCSRSFCWVTSRSKQRTASGIACLLTLAQA